MFIRIAFIVVNIVMCVSPGFMECERLSEGSTLPLVLYEQSLCSSYILITIIVVDIRVSEQCVVERIIATEFG